jgi:hypothetical protein
MRRAGALRMLARRVRREGIVPGSLRQQPRDLAPDVVEAVGQRAPVAAADVLDDHACGRLADGDDEGPGAHSGRH